VALRRLPGERVFLGGHSYGGRQASLLAAARPALADGLLLVAYPLHPPGRPGELRTAHLPGLRTPALFLHGSEDAFGTLEEMRAALALIPAPSRLVAVDGGRHDLARVRAAAVAAGAAAFVEFFGIA
jgi:predicted alpha/beta-hydrolase family hydrolase